MADSRGNLLSIWRRNTQVRPVIHGYDEKGDL